MSGAGPETERGPAPGGGEDAAGPMRLRPEPPRVTRLSRKVLAGLGLVAGLGIGGALIYALQSPRNSDQGKELFATDNRATPDGLASLPRDYSSVPQLGPPLPGDLGRPIVSAQEAGKPVTVPAIAAPNPALGEAEQARLREAEAARTAKLFTTTTAQPTPAAVSPPAATTASASQPSLAGLGLAPLPAMGEMGVSDEDAALAIGRALNAWRADDFEGDKPPRYTPGMHVLRQYEEGARDWSLELWVLAEKDSGRLVKTARLHAIERGEATAWGYPIEKYEKRSVFAVDLVGVLDRIHPRNRPTVN